MAVAAPPPDAGPPAADAGPPIAADAGPPIAAIAAALRRERQRTGMTLSEVARRAGIAKSTLSQLEAGTGNPSIETLWALGVALGVPFSQLVDPPAPQVRVVRADERTTFHADRADFAATLLSAGKEQARRDLYVLALAPGSARLADAHIPGSVEHIVVAAGRLRTGPADALIDLDPGDYASFPGDVPHSYEALVPGTWAVLMMEHR